MNTDNKILKALEDLQADVKGLKQGQQAIAADVAAVKDVQQKQGKQLEGIGSDGKTLNNKVDRLQDGQGHIHTALKIVATKQDVEVAVDAAKVHTEEHGHK